MNNIKSLMNFQKYDSSYVVNLFKSNKVLVKYISVSYLSIPVSIVTGFLAFRKIDPYLMGIWTAFTVFETYATFMRLGLINGMNREMPFAQGQGQHHIAERFASTTLAYTLFNIAVFVLASPFVLIASGFSKIYLITSLIFLIRVCLSFYITFLSATFRSEDSFNRLSNIHAVVIIMKLLFSPLIFLGFYGFLVYELTAVLTNTVLLHYYRPMKVKPTFHMPEFKKLLKIGFPIFIVSSALSYIDTIPRLYLINYAKPEKLGIYAPIAMLLSMVAILPNTLSAYMYPKFSYHLGQAKSIQEVWRKLLKIYGISFLIIATISIVGYFFVDYFAYLFPKYKESLPYLKLSLLICPFAFFKLGNMVNVLLKNYTFMLLFALIYGGIQISSIYIISLNEIDLLNVVVEAQIVSSVIMLFIGLVLNRYVISLSIRKK